MFSDDRHPLNDQNGTAKPDSKRLPGTTRSILARIRPEVPRPHRSASGIDLIAIAEATLFPDIPPRKLTGRQMAAAAQLAKRHLVELGQWPENTAERQHRKREAERREATA